MLSGLAFQSHALFKAFEKKIERKSEIIDQEKLSFIEKWKDIPSRKNETNQQGNVCIFDVETFPNEEEGDFVLYAGKIYLVSQNAWKIGIVT